VPYQGLVAASVPWVPTNDEVINRLVETLSRYMQRLGRGVFMDVGCGDGRVAIAVARRLQIPTICIELKDELASRARMNAERSGVGHLVEVVQADFFTYPLTSAKYVYMYLLLSVNTKLEPKLNRELRKGALVVTLDFPMPSWRPIEQIEVDGRSWQRKLYVYMAGVSNSENSH